jgi:hypothetical protein
MLTNWLIARGFSRDDLTWYWAQILSVAAAVTSNAFDLKGWAAKLGIPLSEVGKNWIFFIALFLLWYSAKQSKSTLPSAATVEKRKEMVEANMGTDAVP